MIDITSEIGNDVMILILKSGFLLILIVSIYFLIATRLSLTIHSLLNKKSASSHIYWIYRNRFLIWLTDRPLIISAILFFNYNRLVDRVVQEMNPSLEGKQVLQASCAFGSVSEKITEKCLAEGAKKVVIFDLLANEIKHTRNKLKDRKTDQYCRYLLEDAAHIAHKDESFDYVIIFFLFHELPYEKKTASLKEAARVLKPGGKILFAEFHKPEQWLLRFSGQCFFKIFEPFAKEMWETFDAAKLLDEESSHKWKHTKKTFFYGNYQVFTAEKIL